MTYVRERYSASKRPSYSQDELRAEFDRVQRGIPHPPVTIDMRDLAQPGRDFAEALQRAHNALPSTGGTIRFPAMSAAWLLDGNGATLAAPKIGVTITKSNVWIVGDGDTALHMANWDQTDAAGAGADVVGANVFTAFLFDDEVVGGGVYGIYVTGESDDSALTVGEPRAKVVGIDGASEIRVEWVRGVDIVGNTVNARGEGSGLGAARRNIVTNCHAENCSENGFNFMGGTHDSVFSHNIAINNEFQGFESGTYGLTCHGNHFIGNKNGVSHVGRYASITGNVCRGNTVSGVHLQYNTATFNGAENVVAHNNCYENSGLATAAGILVDGSTTRNVLKGNRCVDNGSASQGEGIKLATGASDYLIEGNYCADTGSSKQRYGIDVIVSNDVTLIGNRTVGHVTWGLLVQGASDRLTVMGNDFDDELVSISASATNVLVRNNRGYEPSVSVASASAITLPLTSNVFTITGTTDIDSITASSAHRGRIVTLVFAGALTVNDGSNLVLYSNFTTAADSVLALACDGTDWFELSRSLTGITSMSLDSLTVGALTATGTSHIFGSNAGAGQQVRLNGAAGNSRMLAFETAGADRWLMGANNTAESGSDAGSNFFLNAMTDAGATIDTAFAMTRAAAGVARWNRPLALSAVSPAQITADQNNYTPTGYGVPVWRLTSDASRNITGIGSPIDARWLIIVNVGAQNIVLQNQNASSADANKVITGTGADITIAPDDIVNLWYDGTTARWRVVSHY